MSRAGQSFFWFSFWVLGCGLALALFPRLMLDMAGITVSSDIMVRVFGTVLLYMGVYYLVAARRPSFAPLYLASVYTRFSAPVIVGLFVLLTKASPLIVAFTVVDALGALWTALALRRDQAALSIPLLRRPAALSIPLLRRPAALSIPLLRRPQAPPRASSR